MLPRPGILFSRTLHTINVVETVNRLYGLFPPQERHLVQQQIASTLNLTVAQRLVKNLPEAERPL